MSRKKKRIEIEFLPFYQVPEVYYYSKEDTQELKDALLKCCEFLSLREVLLLKLRFGLFGEKPYTFEKLSSCFAISRERARQIMDNALRKLRHPRIVKYLKDWR